MRVRLELTSGNRVLLWRILDRPRFTIGSNPQADLCIPDSNVASLHAVLHWQNGVLELLNRSPQGTRIGDETVTIQWRLAHGDKIELGPVQATVCFFESNTTVVAKAAGLETKALALEPLASVNDWQLVVAGSDGDLRTKLSPEGISVGTDSSNDIVVSDPYVSRHHARFFVKDNRAFVTDLGSRNGVTIDGQRLVEGELSPHKKVMLGQTPAFVMSADAGDDLERPSHSTHDRLVGVSPAIRQLRMMIKRVAANTAPVLILGETGTGKDVVAKLIAAASERPTAPLVAINCGALSRNLVESELFGHEKGAFTGAFARKLGAFEVADGGTLFLDEIGELPLELQPQLLRVLESGEVRRVGSNDAIAVDTRIIAATHRRLEREVAEGRFREDLLHRLHVLVVEIPPLRERREDIPLLVDSFLAEFAPRHLVLAFDAEAQRLLTEHSYPGNVRELRNVVQRAVLMRESDVMSASDIKFMSSVSPERSSLVPSATLGDDADTPKRRTLLDMEREAIVAELVRHQGNRKEVSLALGVSRSTIHRKIEEFSIDVDAIMEQKAQLARRWG